MYSLSSRKIQSPANGTSKETNVVFDMYQLSKIGRSESEIGPNLQAISVQNDVDHPLPGPNLAGSAAVRLCSEWLEKGASRSPMENQSTKVRCVGVQNRQTSQSQTDSDVATVFWKKRGMKGKERVVMSSIQSGFSFLQAHDFPGSPKSVVAWMRKLW